MYTKMKTYENSILVVLNYIDHFYFLCDNKLIF